MQACSASKSRSESAKLPPSWPPEISPSDRHQHLGKPRRISASSRRDWPLSHRNRLPDSRRAGARAAESPARSYPARRGCRSRSQSIDLFARSRRQRSRAVLGQTQRPMAAHSRWQAGNVHPQTRSDPTAKRSCDGVATKLRAARPLSGFIRNQPPSALLDGLGRTSRAGL
jgi:hypothetical protein